MTIDIIYVNSILVVYKLKTRILKKWFFNKSWGLVFH